MKLELKFGTHLCYTPLFKINGIQASEDDFGEKYDRSPETAEGYACGNMQYTRNPSSPEILEKYAITEGEYSQIAERLEEGLSFGCCGRCV